MSFQDLMDIKVETLRKCFLIVDEAHVFVKDRKLLTLAMCVNKSLMVSATFGGSRGLRNLAETIQCFCTVEYLCPVSRSFTVSNVDSHYLDMSYTGTLNLTTVQMKMILT